MKKSGSQCQARRSVKGERSVFSNSDNNSKSDRSNLNVIVKVSHVKVKTILFFIGNQVQFHSYNLCNNQPDN